MRRPGLRRSLTVTLAAAAALPLAAATPASARIVDLGADFVPWAVNNKQVVAGDVVDPVGDGDPHAGVWKAGTLIHLPEPAGTTMSDAVAINQSGRVAGTVRLATGATHAVYWDPPYTAQPTQAGPIGAVPAGEDFSRGEAVDDAGGVYGTTTDYSSDPHRVSAFRLLNGSLTRIGGISAPTMGARAVSADGSQVLGEVVGLSAPDDGQNGWYVWPGNGGSGTKLSIKPFAGPAPSFSGSIASTYGNSLASDGTMLGFTGADANSATGWYLRAPDGALTVINGLAGHNAVNGRRFVAGTTIKGTDILTLRAAVWHPDGAITDVNAQQAAGTDWILYTAFDLSDNNDVVGLGVKGAEQHAFLIPGGFTVDSNGDQLDATVGDGACLTAANTCTLRAALQEVSAGTSTEPVPVDFDLAPADTTISPATALPAAARPIAIDATKNRGGLVTIDGISAGDSNGLVFQGDRSTMRGLRLTHFKRAGLRVAASRTRIGGIAGVEQPCTFPCNQFIDNVGPAVSVAGAGSLDNAIRGNRMTGNARPAIDLGADGRTPNDKADADAGANALQNFPIGVLAEQDPVTLKVLISGVVSPDAHGQTIDIYSQSAVAAARGAAPDRYVGSTTVTVTGGFILERPAALPADQRFFSATLTDATNGTSELSPICGDPDGDGNPDSDGDGLCDDWELQGLDADDDGTVDLPLQSAAFGAKPDHKDLFVEVDAMQSSTGTPYAPSLGAIEDVVAAFAQAPVTNKAGGDGVALHVNPGGSNVDDAAIPEDQTIRYRGRGVGTIEHVRSGDPSAPCDGYLGSATDRSSPNCAALLAARELAFRWGLFGYDYAEYSGSSGVALGIGGNAFAVTLGSWSSGDMITMGGGLSVCHSVAECRRAVVSGTLMHEFGHTLGLHHGGRDDLNFKANYLSIMSYSYQFKSRSPDRPLDYSRFALPSLDENHLVDGVGVGGSLDAATQAKITAKWPHIAYYLYNPATSQCELHATTLGAPIDWDFSAPTSQSATSVHDQCASGFSTLTSTEDWPDLRYSSRDQPGALSISTGDGSQQPPEESNATILADLARSDADGNGVNDLADRCRIVAGTDLADANGDGFADACAPELERFKALPGQANGAGAGSTQSGGSGAPGGPAADRTAPSIKGLSARPSSMTRARGKRKAKPAKLGFSLSEPATVTVTAERSMAGHTVGKRGCVTTRGAKGKACVKLTAVAGALRVDGVAGANALAFVGQLGTAAKGKPLAAGKYRLTFVAIDAAGNRSAPATVDVTVK